MTHHANRILDEALGGESDSPIRFGLRDASEVSLGRITRDGYLDRRFKIRHAPPEPIEPEGWAFVAQVALGTVVYGGLIVGLFLWLAIAEAARV